MEGPVGRRVGVGVGALLGKRVGRVGKSVGVDGATVLGA